MFSPVLWIKKRSGELRVTIDLRTVNAYIETWCSPQESIVLWPRSEEFRPHGKSLHYWMSVLDSSTFQLTKPCNASFVSKQRPDAGNLSCCRWGGGQLLAYF